MGHDGVSGDRYTLELNLYTTGDLIVEGRKTKQNKASDLGVVSFLSEIFFFKW